MMMAKAKASKEKFPTTVYVKLEGGGRDGTWLNATEEVSDLGETGRVRVAIYDLRDVRTLVTKPVLE